MSFYQPFYYPFFSARADLPPSLIELDRKLHYGPPVTQPLLDQQARQIEMEGLVRSNYARAELERMAEERRIEAEVQAQLQLRKESDYLQRIATLRRERELLEMARQPELSARERVEAEVKEKHQATRESYMTDDQLLRHYATGQKYNEYQREVTGRLVHQAEQPSAKTVLAAKLAYSHETENSPHKIEKMQAQANGKQSERNIRNNAHQEESSKHERDRLAVQAFKRSYIDELNDSKGHSIEKGNNYLKPRGDTIDLLPRSQLDMPFLQHRYGAVSKNKKKRRSNQSISHFPKKKQNKDISLLGTTNNRTFTATTANEAMKKINNRLKVSAIVYKDSKLRNERHELEHLLNTFQIEVKGRKEVKDRINNNPDILKKHHMVVPY